MHPSLDATATDPDQALYEHLMDDMEATILLTAAKADASLPCKIDIRHAISSKPDPLWEVMEHSVGYTYAPTSEELMQFVLDVAYKGAGSKEAVDILKRMAKGYAYITTVL